MNVKSIVFILISGCLSLNGQVSLPRLISDGLVLQRSTATHIWGYASPGEKITINFIDSVYSSITDNSGNWNVYLDIPVAGGPYTMTITGNNIVELTDILIGDVWLCSGQSNMELTMQRAAPAYPDEIKNCEQNMIRYFEVPDRYNFKNPEEDLPGGKWISPNPSTIFSFSAVSYFYAKELFEKYLIPIGIINASLGGSPVESWISEESLKSFPVYYNEMLRFKSDSLISAIESQNRKRFSAWQSELRKKDEGFKDPSHPWNDPDFNDKNWEEAPVPGYWADIYKNDKNGVFWFRKTFRVPENMAGKEALLLLGRVIDSDSVYVNGVFVGTTGYMYPPRRYNIPEGLLKHGLNNITIRVISSGGKGGFVPDKPYRISSDEGEIDLSGNWKFRKGADMEPMQGSETVRWKPGGLYNAMISPLIPYTLKGVVWYQGESNATRYNEYPSLFSAMINCWRKGWGDASLPFVYVQLPNYMESTAEPVYSEWAFMREAQASVLKIPNTAMAVAIDLGEWNDIHPLNKKDVAHRVALKSEKLVYGERNLVASGPRFSGMFLRGDTAVISFTDIGGGLVTRDNNEPGGFTVAGKDGIFHHASAEIRDEEVLVWSETVHQPIAVRYAWENNPVRANLYNKEGLPAEPFRTDSLGR